MKTWQKLRRDPKLFERYFIRERVLTAIRRFFLDRGFHEVETPYLTGSLPPESYLDVFETTLYSRDRTPTTVYLPTSPEPFIKKLLVAGIGNCFSLGKSFRNTEDKSLTHNPEFTILEWYRVDSDYTSIMKDSEELIRFIHTYLSRSGTPHASGTLSNVIRYDGKAIDLGKPWERLRVRDAFLRYAGFDLADALDKPSIARFAKKKGYAVTAKDTWEVLFNQIFLHEIEPNLGMGVPTILYEYPAIGGVAGLALKHEADPRFAERFEFYIGGLEMGDAYTELTDWKEQLERFRKETRERKRLGKVMHPIDMDFIDALKEGMPPSGGIAVGVDRLIMLFSGTKDIADTMFFPMRDLLPSAN